eukprot:357794-Chlamydomonas_euryale.AAC.4
MPALAAALRRPGRGGRSRPTRGHGGATARLPRKYAGGHRCHAATLLLLLLLLLWLHHALAAVGACRVLLQPLVDATEVEHMAARQQPELLSLLVRADAHAALPGVEHARATAVVRFPVGRRARWRCRGTGTGTGASCRCWRRWPGWGAGCGHLRRRCRRRMLSAHPCRRARLCTHAPLNRLQRCPSLAYPASRKPRPLAVSETLRRLLLLRLKRGGAVLEHRVHVGVRLRDAFLAKVRKKAVDATGDDQKPNEAPPRGPHCRFQHVWAVVVLLTAAQRSPLSKLPDANAHPQLVRGTVRVREVGGQDTGPEGGGKLVVLKGQAQPVQRKVDVPPGVWRGPQEGRAVVRSATRRRLRRGRQREQRIAARYNRARQVAKIHNKIESLHRRVELHVDAVKVPRPLRCARHTGLEIRAVAHLRGAGAMVIEFYGFGL